MEGFFHLDLHAKFQPIRTGAIREIAPADFGGKSQLFVTRPAGPLLYRLYESIVRFHRANTQQCHRPLFSLLLSAWSCGDMNSPTMKQSQKVLQ